MRAQPNLRAEHWRQMFGSDDESPVSGMYIVRFNGRDLRVIASDGLGWEHVSVSLPDRCPTWTEMDHICRLFWRDDETVMQLHVPKSDHVNNHPYCLHLWKPVDASVVIPRPDVILVGVK